MTEEKRLARLRRPDVNESVDVVLDTDTFNEIDDQYALSYLVRSGSRINVKAICAAPFFNSLSSSPADGMEKSYNEIQNILTLLGREDLKKKSFRGSDRYLPDEKTPVASDAADALIALADAQGEDRPLYVVAIGAITNVASALLRRPDLIEKIVLVWLGGHAFDWHDTKEFNLIQDVAAARVVFGSGVPLVQYPCMGVVSAFTSTGPELTHWLKGRNALCDYLVDITVKEAESYAAGRVWSRVIWDVTAVSWLTGDFCSSRLEPSPIPSYDGHYAFDRTRHLIRYVYGVNRDALLQDLFAKLAETGK